MLWWVLGTAETFNKRLAWNMAIAIIGPFWNLERHHGLPFLKHRHICFVFILGSDEIFLTSIREILVALNTTPGQASGMIKSFVLTEEPLECVVTWQEGHNKDVLIVRRRGSLYDTANCFVSIRVWKVTFSRIAVPHHYTANLKFSLAAEEAMICWCQEELLHNSVKRAHSTTWFLVGIVW